MHGSINPKKIAFGIMKLPFKRRMAMFDRGMFIEATIADRTIGKVSSSWELE